MFRRQTSPTFGSPGEDCFKKNHQQGMCVRVRACAFNFIVLIISRSVDLQKIACISYVRLKNCLFHLFRSSASSFSPKIFCFQIIKELCYFSSYSFHFNHLSFTDIMKEAISSQNMINPISYSAQDIT